MSSPIGDIRLAIIVLEASDDPAARRVAAALQHYDAERGATTTDKALHVASMPGQTTWWAAEALDRRTAAIRAIRERECPDMGVTAASREIAKRCRRYTGSSRRDPLLDAATENGRCSLQERRIRDYLGNERGLLVARKP